MTAAGFTTWGRVGRRLRWGIRPPAPRTAGLIPRIDCRCHAFAQFGAGTFTPGVRTRLSRFVLVDPLALAALATPYHQAANRARELARGASRHGSCGMGIGETASYALAYPGDAPRIGDCATPRVLARKLHALRDRLAGELGPLAERPRPVAGRLPTSIPPPVTLSCGSAAHTKRKVTS